MTRQEMHKKAKESIRVMRTIAKKSRTKKERAREKNGVLRIHTVGARVKITGF